MFRRTRIFFTLLGALLVLRSLLRFRWQLEGRGALFLGSRADDLALTFAALAAGVLLISAAVNMPRLWRAAWLSFAGGALFLGGELIQLAGAWRTSRAMATSKEIWSAIAALVLVCCGVIFSRAARGRSPPPPSGTGRADPAES